jgi:photosystem II stability/assembly factor-like uncharacterized protein
MSMTRPQPTTFVLGCLLFAHSPALAAPTPTPAPPPDLFRELRWRSIGPFRGGRTKAAAGIPDRPFTFYVGACNGGVWKTIDAGRTWTPIFDDQPTGSIGAIAIAPSAPDVVYVGSGEGLQRPDLSTGDGIYKSTDGGKSWRHLGLQGGQQIPQIAVDPHDPNRLFVAVLGHPYGPNSERGVFRSRDGGASFEKVLYRDPDTGAADVVMDPTHPQIVFATLWESRQGPWENGVFSGPGSGLYKSTDGGTTWRHITKGLPDFAHDHLGRIGLAIAPSAPQRMYATVEAKMHGGLYRSDDGGESWSRVTDDNRVAERASDFAEVKVHPRNPDIVFTASVVTWKSVDGGKTFTALRGAPGGDDYHRIWLNPLDPNILLLASDQGAIVTLNGGQTWSSWYNQPTAQMYHVNADNAFPYRVCGGQQESGSACVASRGMDGAITMREWHPVGAEEYGYAVPDPLDADIIFGGKLSRYDRRTGQTQDVTPRPLGGDDYRVLRTQPVVFSPLDPHTLYFASNTVWKTSDGGRHWVRVSPDLTRAGWEVPASVAKYRGEVKPTQRGVVYALAPSPVDARTLWAGTDDGLIHVTRDGGKHWRDVTPPALGPWAKVSIMDAGHGDADTAYAAVNTLRLDDLRPHIYRTHDGGKSWREITEGLPAGGIVNVVREDPRKKRLLYAGTEQAAFVSFDDGEHWTSLRRNMPATSIRDLIINDDDLVVATHGRGFWILDDVEPLRQYQPSLPPVHLFKPAPAVRARWNTNTDTPLPPDEPMGRNPPEGAILDYYLAARPDALLTLEILDQGGAVIRRFTSADPAATPRDEGNIPRYWIRAPRPVSADPGLHRFVWDLRRAPPDVLEPSYPIAAVPGETPRGPQGAWVLPGTYRVRLTAGEQTVTQPLTVTMDPRVRTPQAALREQYQLAVRVEDALRDNHEAALALRALKLDRKALAPALAGELTALEAEPGPRGSPTGLAAQNGRLAHVFELLEGSDDAPTPQLVQATDLVLREAKAVLVRWRDLRVRLPSSP